MLVTTLAVICFISFLVFIIAIVMWLKNKRQLPFTKKSLLTKQRYFTIIIVIFLIIFIITFISYSIMVNQ